MTRRGRGDAPEPAATAGPPDPSDPADRSRRDVITWLWRVPVLAVLGGAGYGLYQAITVHFLKRRPALDPVFEDAPDAMVGPLAAFAGDWDAVEFMVATSTGQTPAVALRLPGPVPGGLDVGSVHLVAFSRVCTHQHCIVSLNTDIDAINLGFNYGTDSPALTCPCHLSVFDPLLAGRAVSGPATLPLPRVRLASRGDLVVATGLETA